MKRSVLALGLFVFCGCKPATPVTPPGTVLFDWDLAKAGRATVRGAKIGPKTPKDFVVHVLAPDSDPGGPTLDVALHVEVAPIDFEEGGKPVHQLAPVSIRATVKNNDAWDSSRSHCDEKSGPNYLMGPTNPDGSMSAPPGMVQDCIISYHRNGGFLRHSSWDLGMTVNVNGDGTVKPFPKETAKIE